ncbi:MAG: hypothetical protein KJ620_03070 [Candidatus Edwardsbacteria bacterium]|nr:hypothetical protein [Candidatus Edwardsbacteria bacterium]MBU1575699.1 hypothetical protein [Candidatus Edwardsbacteria bacterium]MBU2464094.1 hypothetical protein [Candidatus Edwardsbacteria bacterium]MBU2594664.1 hypothetical protein [Candidatus Edwardsbacteria bacterium]
MAGKYRWIPILLTLVTLLSCSKKNPVGSDGTTQSDYYPISSGSWWKYSSFWDYTDSIGETDTLSTGSLVYALYTITAGYTMKVYLQKTDKEIRRYPSLSDTNYILVLLKYPLYVGLKWEVTPYPLLANYDSMYVIGLGSITVPAGTFPNCYKILRKRDNIREDPVSTVKWYAPNVGFVFNPEDSTKLISYSIK